MSEEQLSLYVSMFPQLDKEVIVDVLRAGADKESTEITDMLLQFADGDAKQKLGSSHTQPAFSPTRPPGANGGLSGGPFGGAPGSLSSGPAGIIPGSTSGAGTRAGVAVAASLPGGPSSLGGITGGRTVGSAGSHPVSPGSGPGGRSGHGGPGGHVGPGGPGGQPGQLPRPGPNGFPTKNLPQQTNNQKRLREEQGVQSPYSPQKKPRMEKDFYFIFEGKETKLNVCLGTPIMDVLFTVGQIYKLKPTDFVLKRADNSTLCTFGYNFPQDTKFLVCPLDLLATQNQTQKNSPTQETQETQESQTSREDQQYRFAQNDYHLSPTAPPLSPSDSFSGLYPSIDVFKSGVINGLRDNPVEIDDDNEESYPTQNIHEEDGKGEGKEDGEGEDSCLASSEEKTKTNPSDEEEEEKQGGLFSFLFG